MRICSQDPFIHCRNELTDETTSAISEMHQGARSPEINAATTAPAPGVETPVGTTAGEIGSPTSNTAASQRAATSSEPRVKASAAAPDAEITNWHPDRRNKLVNFRIGRSATSSLVMDDSEASIPQEPASPRLPRSLLARFERNTPAELSYGRDRAALIGKLIDNAGMPVSPFHIISAFIVALVIMSYYALFSYFLSPEHLGRWGARRSQATRRWPRGRFKNI